MTITWAFLRSLRQARDRKILKAFISVHSKYSTRFRRSRSSRLDWLSVNMDSINAQKATRPTCLRRKRPWAATICERIPSHAEDRELPTGTCQDIGMADTT